jgi:predicted PurR-regulated permease PerM
MRSEIPLWTLRGIGLALGVVLVYALLQLGIAAARVFLLVFIAVLLASALEPMLGWLRHRVSVLSRAGTILVVYLTFIVTVVGLAFVVVPAAVGQASGSSPTCRRSSRRFGRGPTPSVRRPLRRH